MCGIVGIWSQSDEKIIAQMAQSVIHRGPDGLDWVTIGNSSFGASRLVIFGDPAASAIFFDPSANMAIMLNGEIYNIASLRASLLSNGCFLQTELETEVLLELYKREGLDFPKLLQGMFAIAILDGNSLVLIRDRFGIKPLYYANIGKRVLFGSEMKAILIHPDFQAQLHFPALDEIMVFGYIHSLDKTLFEGIVQVKPGTAISFSEEGQVIKKYWQAPHATYFDPEQHLDYPTALVQLRHLIIQTMDTLLSHGNHPIGIYLSGGLDSTILTLVTQNILGYPVTTFTLADNSDTADLLAAREVARKLDTQHIERRVTVDDYFNGLKHFVKHYESVVAGGVFDIHGGMAFHLLSETVSNYVKVALSGEGADELFGGYYWIYTHPLGFADRMRNRLQQTETNGNGLRKVIDTLFPFPENEYTYRRNLFDDLIKGGLANYHLQSVDRSAGAFGFEIRPPYLSDELATFVLNLPIDYKVPNQQITKRILREAFKPELEQLGLSWVLTRLKEGMPAAVSTLDSIIKQRIEDSINDSEFSRHPKRKYIRNKMDMYLFDLFSEIFLPECHYAISDCVSQ